MERAQALLQNLAEFFQMPLPETVRHISICAIFELNEFFDSLFSWKSYMKNWNTIFCFITPLTKRK